MCIFNLMSVKLRSGRRPCHMTSVTFLSVYQVEPIAVDYNYRFDIPSIIYVHWDFQGICVRLQCTYFNRTNVFIYAQTLWGLNRLHGPPGAACWRSAPRASGSPVGSSDGCLPSCKPKMAVSSAASVCRYWTRFDLQQLQVSDSLVHINVCLAAEQIGFVDRLAAAM